MTTFTIEYSGFAEVEAESAAEAEAAFLETDPEMQVHRVAKKKDYCG